MFAGQNDDDVMVTLKLTTADGCALSGVLKEAMESDNPLVQMAGQHLLHKLTAAVIEQITPETAIEEIDEVLAQDDLPEHARQRALEVRAQIAARDSITEDEAEAPDVQGAIDRILGEADGSEPV